ncbi:hypothetical protein [Stieleria varia]|nr:hypothetical protein [Stieleria varia]
MSGATRKEDARGYLMFLADDFWHWSLPGRGEMWWVVEEVLRDAESGEIEWSDRAEELVTHQLRILLGESLARRTDVQVSVAQAKLNSISDSMENFLRHHLPSQSQQAVTLSQLSQLGNAIASLESEIQRVFIEHYLLGTSIDQLAFDTRRSQGEILRLLKRGMNEVGKHRHDRTE